MPIKPIGKAQLNPLVRFFEKEITRQVNARLSVVESDNNFYVGGRSINDVFKDRLDYDRQFIIEQALLAWRSNPIARRVVALTNEFVIGDGFTWDCIKAPYTKRFLEAFWNHLLNDLESQMPEWVDEVTRSGDLLLLFSVDTAGMSYVRAIPSEQISEIQCVENDYRQEKFYISSDPQLSPWPAYDPSQKQDHFIIHFAANRPAGATFGESDLAPLLKWFSRLSTILEDRVVLAHLHNLIAYIVRGEFKDENARKKREAELNLNPPRAGAILVTDESEEWSILAPMFSAFDAQQDILAIKKMISAGSGVPLHYLAEPESSTKTTAEAAGTPTFRHFTRRQDMFKHIIRTVLTTACQVRHSVDPRINAKPFLTVNASDITERDNAAMALAAARIEPILADLFDRELIDSKTFLTLLYAFAGQDYQDDDANVPVGKRRPLTAPRSPTQPNTAVQPDEVNPEDKVVPNQ
jgi:hypothetical protein